MPHHGKGGRPRTPDELRALMGLKPRNPGSISRAYTLAENVPIPSFIERDRVAMEEWVRLLPEVVETRMLKPVNLAVFICICLAHAGSVHAEDDVYEQGRWITEPVFDKRTGAVTGEKRTLNPNIKLAEMHRAAMKNYMIEFGLTPAAESRVNVERDRKPGEDLSDLFEDEKPN